MIVGESARSVIIISTLPTNVNFTLIYNKFLMCGQILENILYTHNSKVIFIRETVSSHFNNLLIALHFIRFRRWSGCFCNYQVDGVSFDGELYAANIHK